MHNLSSGEYGETLIIHTGQGECNNIKVVYLV